MKGKDRLSRRVIFRNKFFIVGGILLFVLVCVMATRHRLFSEFTFGGYGTFGWIAGPVIFLTPVYLLQKFSARFSRHEAEQNVNQMPGAARLLRWPLVFGPAVVLTLIAAGLKYYLLGRLTPTMMKVIFLFPPVSYVLPVLLIPIVAQWLDINRTLSQEIPYLKRRIDTPPAKVRRFPVFIEFGLAFLIMGAAFVVFDIQGSAQMETRRIGYSEQSLGQLYEGFSKFIAQRKDELRGRATDEEIAPDKLSEFKPKRRNPAVYLDPTTGDAHEFIYVKHSNPESVSDSEILIAAPIPYREKRLILRFDLKPEWRDEEDIPASLQK